MPIAEHLSTLHLHFDAFYTGYLASPKQVELLTRILNLLADDGTHIFVDPAFADHGRLYTLMDATMPASMRTLCARAHTIVPNMTEAALLLGVAYREANYDEAYVRSLAVGLGELGPENVVLTDVSFTPDQTGIAIYRRRTDSLTFAFRKRYDGMFHGTGDVFASFLLSALLGGLTLSEAATLALDCTHASIRYTLADGEPLRYGVQFERALPMLMERLGTSEDAQRWEASPSNR